MVTQGYSGNELIKKFEQQQRSMVKALDIVKTEADEIASGRKKGASMKDIFGEE